MIYVIGALFVALSVTGYMLKTSWQSNAIHEANALQYQQAIRETSEELAEEVARGDRLNVLYTESRQAQQSISNALSDMRQRLTELKRSNADVQDFYLNCGDLPDDLYQCLRSRACRASDRGGNEVPADAVRDGNAHS